MKMLVVDCCIREELSATRKLYEAYLKKLQKDVTIEIIFLNKEMITPLTDVGVKLRDDLLGGGKLEHEIFKYAKQFAAADEILIAAPYWDLSFPSLLKVYLERVSVVGITFGYEGAKCVGYCNAKRILYFSTCGGFVTGAHQGVEYVRLLAAMFGIHEIKAYTVQGLDIEPSKRSQILDDGIRNIPEGF